MLLIEKTSPSQLGFRSLEGQKHDIPDITRCFIEIETHSLAAETFRDDVELDAILINHIRNAPPIFNNLTPPISIEKLRTQLTSRYKPLGTIPKNLILINLWLSSPACKHFFKPNKCLSTPLPSLAADMYSKCASIALRNRDTAV